MSLALSPPPFGRLLNAPSDPRLASLQKRFWEWIGDFSKPSALQLLIRRPNLLLKIQIGDVKLTDLVVDDVFLETHPYSSDKTILLVVGYFLTLVKLKSLFHLHLLFYFSFFLFLLNLLPIHLSLFFTLKVQSYLFLLV